MALWDTQFARSRGRENRRTTPASGGSPSRPGRYLLGYLEGWGPYRAAYLGLVVADHGPGAQAQYRSAGAQHHRAENR